MEYTQKVLEELIIKANQDYRDGRPTISDKEYDCLEEDLRLAFPTSELFKKGKLSISQKQFRKRKLPIEMRSLDKVKSLEELKEWIEVKGLSPEVLITITPKYDGISLVRSERTGETWSSGDGFEGQLCTDHLKKTVHTDLDINFFSVGEAIIPVKEWKTHFEGKISLVSNQPFKASRNTVSGLFNNDNPELVSKYLEKVHYIPYSLFNANGTPIPIAKSKLLLLINEKAKTMLIPSASIRANYLTEKALEDLYFTWSQDHRIDGLVVDIDFPELRADLGFELNGNPAYARAVKLPQWTGDVQSKVVSIERQVSKQGLIKPVICIEPVQIGEVTVSRVNGLNMKFIEDWDIQKGVEVTLIRSGDVIPRLKSVNGVEIPYREDYKTSKEYEEVYESQISRFQKTSRIPDSCPCCRTKLEWTETGVDQYCPNPFCFDRVTKQLEWFFVTVGVTKVGEITCRALLQYIRDEAGEEFAFTESLNRLLKLGVHELMSVSGFGRDSANGLFRQLLKVKAQGISLARLWDALGYFEGMGEKTLQLIINELKITSTKDLHAIYMETDIEGKGSESLTMDSLLKVDGVSTITATNFIKGLSFYFEVFPVHSFLISLYNESTPADSNGHIVCCTNFRFSEEEKKALTSKGYAVTESFSKKTTILVAKDKTEKTGKVKKAIEYGLPIYNRSELHLLT